MARSGWSGCAAIGARPACSRPAAARGSNFPTAARHPGGRRAKALPAASCRWVERLQRLVEGVDQPISPPSPADGLFIGPAAAAVRCWLSHSSTAGLDDASSDRLKQGRVETPVGIGTWLLQRVGTAAIFGLIALISLGANAGPPMRRKSRRTCGSPGCRNRTSHRSSAGPRHRRPMRTSGIDGEAPASLPCSTSSPRTRRRQRRAWTKPVAK